MICRSARVVGVVALTLVGLLCSLLIVARMPETSGGNPPVVTPLNLADPILRVKGCGTSDPPTLVVDLGSLTGYQSTEEATNYARKRFGKEVLCHKKTRLFGLKWNASMFSVVQKHSYWYDRKTRRLTTVQYQTIGGTLGSTTTRTTTTQVSAGQVGSGSF